VIATLKPRNKPAIIAVSVAVCLVAAWAIPHFIHARSPNTIPKAYWSSCVFYLSEIESAKEQWAKERNATNGQNVTWDDLLPYIGREQSGHIPKCPDGGVYTIGKVGEKPTCSIGGKDHMLPDSK
jgi:hypothetical protein